MSGGEIILIDDERAMRESLSQWLELAGYSVTTFASGTRALDVVSPVWPGVVITDLRMADLDGLAVLEEIMACDRNLPVILITGHGDVSSAVQAMQGGAYDFIEKPFSPERIGGVVARALEKRALVLENRALRHCMARERRLEDRLIGDCGAMRKLREDIEHFAAVDVDILIIGETGTGKEVVARCLHELGPRCGAPFRAIDCGTISPTRIESELFGESGGRASPFELADGGTVLLDEVLNMPLDQQTKLLRAIEEREIRRVGESHARPFDVRLITVANEGLRDALDTGTFRADLYFRLNTIELVLPPLRDREDDSIRMFEHFVRAAARSYERSPPEVTARDVAAVRANRWPGNVRELQHVAERFVLYESVEVSELLAADTVGGPERRTLVHDVAHYEKSLIEHSLAKNRGDLASVAEELGIPRRTLFGKLQRHEIDQARYKP